MNDNEKKAQDLLNKANTATSDKGANKVGYYRRKKAQDFVQGYKVIMEDKQEYIDAGEDPALYTAAVAEERLVAKWEAKAEVKESAAI